ncbi:aldehyde dehydrogenase family protein [Jiella endophytica]|uniref:Aldehyde dehydrogenase family protein n=2 Tax=Jiella endophytica TaxID=2558362 RepID=A0A4Y8RD24_9HYPH|nr:aldehyde dehydrogenase family protein [Jiella endophytica]
MAYPFETTSDGIATCLMLLDGEWIGGEEDGCEVLDKFTLEPVARLPSSSPRQIAAMLDVAAGRFEADQLSAFERGEILDRVADRILAQADTFLEVMQIETGYTTSDCRNEINRTVETYRLSAEEARRLAGEVVAIAGARGQAKRTAYTLRVPLGVVLAVTPFNAPMNTVAHKLGPALAAGNTVVLKPASQTPRTACLVAQTFLDAGLPAGHLQVFHGSGPAVSAALRDERVRYVAFTGSTGVGRKIQEQAGLRRTQMELGSIAFTILDKDADLERAVPKAIAAGYRKAGQVCTSVQILLVHEDVADLVATQMARGVKDLVYGDPSKDGCVTGPLISLQDAERVEGWIKDALNDGATLLAGGTRENAVVAPTLLSNVTPTMRVGCNEIFGPVVCIETFQNFDAAIARVNSTPYGLATGVFTNRLDHALRATQALRVGGVHINETSSSRADMMPYGGSKDSGFGREGPAYAIKEMTEERLVSFSF